MSPAKAALLEACDLNYAEALRELTRRSGGEVYDRAGLLLYAAADPFPALQDGAMRTCGRLEAPQVLARARDFFGARGRGFSLIVRAHADEDLLAAAAAAGMVQLGSAPGMVLDRRLPDTAPPEGVTLRRVQTAAEAVAFGAVMGAAYESLGFPAHIPPRVFGHAETLMAPHIAAFLAFAGGEPAAGAMTIVTHGVAGIYWVGTLPAARGRGLAELCTRAAGNAGFDLGARIASLQASPMGEPVYRRMGYVEVTRYPLFVSLN
jgi:ribosomal protein S18 acetylase RimI-like enzyme